MLVRPNKNLNLSLKLKSLNFELGLKLAFLICLALAFKTQNVFGQSDEDLFNNIESESFLQDSQLEDPFTDSESQDNGSSENEFMSNTQPNEDLLLNESDVNYEADAFLQNDKPQSTKRNQAPSDQAINDEVNSLEGKNKPKDTKRVKFIKHPGQKQGLYKISADGKYYYRVEESKQKYGLAFKGGAVILNQLQNPDTGVNFNDIYGSGANGAFFLEYYYSYFKNKNVPNILKKARVKFGSGLLVSSGTGRFNNPNYEGVSSSESFTFLAFPNHLGLHLSLEVKGKQLIVPFVTGAFEYIVGVELLNGNFGRTKVLGQLGAHVGGGLALSLGWLDEAAKFDLDHEFGINQTYLTVELRQNIALQQDFDFTATFVNVGIQLEF